MIKDVFFDVNFTKKPFFSIYMSEGGRFTNGNYPNSNTNYDINNKLLIIYDVPSYHDFNVVGKYKLIYSKQYSGAFLNLKDYSSLEDFLSLKYKSKRKAELKKFIRKVNELLGADFVFIGADNYNVNEIELIMSNLFSMIKQRFDQKKTFNRFCEFNEQIKLKKLVMKKISEGKASLAGLKINNKYISASLQFHEKDIMLYSIPTFNTSLSKFNLGHVHLYHLINYCFENNFSLFDFSKGVGVYKGKWTSSEYFYKHLFIFPKKNLLLRFLALITKMKYDFIQFLRDENFSFYLKKIKYKYTNPVFNNTNSSLYVRNKSRMIYDDIFDLDYNTQRIIFDKIYDENILISSISNISFVAGNLIIEIKN